MRSRVIFMGTAELACASLSALVQSPEIHLLAVVTQPDRPKGRDLKMAPSPVKQRALEGNLSVLQPERARDEGFIAKLRELQPDLIVVAAYGQILPLTILELPRFGCLNVHTSLLPKYRGAAPIQWALLHGDSETGVTIMKMDQGLDTGDILAQERIPVLSGNNSQTLHDRLAVIGAELLMRTIPDYCAGKITKEDGCLDWSEPAGALWNRVRAMIPWPGSFTHLCIQDRPTLIKIWEAAVVEGPAGTAGTILEASKAGILVACGKDALRIFILQREGGRRLNAEEFLRGHHLEAGQRFGSK